MNDLALHPKTKQHIELYLKKQPQVLILHGKNGVGLFTIASKISLEITNKHSVLHIAPDDKGVIKIDIIRQLYGQTRTKRATKLFVLIDNADAMLAPAQNALLKLLEDTPKNVVFLLTAHHTQLLLPTIRSRAQEIEVLPLTPKQTLEFLKKFQGLDETKQPQLLFLGTGLPAELYRLTNDQEYFSLRSQQMSKAKDFLAKSLYEKLVIIYKLPNDRSTALTLNQDAMHIIDNTLRIRPKVELASLLEKFLDADYRIRSDGHVRTQLLRLAVSIATA